MNKRKLLFVINPIAGTGNNQKVEKLIHQNLDVALFEYEVFYTEHARQAAQLAELMPLEKFDAVVAVGGDGTVREVARNLVNKPIALGIIPMGSGNGLARHLEIPLTTKDAIRKINTWPERQIDTAKINNHFFVNVAGTGFDAEVSRRFAQRAKRGFWTYLSLTLSSYLNYAPKEYIIQLDGKEKHITAFLIAIANSSQYGNNAYIAPSASTEDGLLDITILKPFSLLQIPALAYLLFRKRIDRHKAIETMKARNIQIKHVANSAHYDGDYFNCSETLNIEAVPGSLQVIA
jgi:YegS/Rv2252/BmrU family lipid kinase